MSGRPSSDELRDVHRGGVAHGERRSVVTVPLVLLIRVYQQTVSRILGPVCRYYPSCSAYGVTALERHGLLRGSWLTTSRILRCHPWAAGGVDHVPAARGAQAPVHSIPHTPVSDAHHRP